MAHASRLGQFSFLATSRHTAWTPAYWWICYMFPASIPHTNRYFKHPQPTKPYHIHTPTVGSVEHYSRSIVNVKLGNNSGFHRLGRYGLSWQPCTCPPRRWAPPWWGGWCVTATGNGSSCLLEERNVLTLGVPSNGRLQQQIMLVDKQKIFL